MPLPLVFLIISPSAAIGGKKPFFELDGYVDSHATNCRTQQVSIWA